MRCGIPRRLEDRPPPHQDLNHRYGAERSPSRYDQASARSPVPHGREPGTNFLVAEHGNNAGSVAGSRLNGSKGGIVYVRRGIVTTFRAETLPAF